MIDYPYLKEQPTSRRTVEVFRGLNRNDRIGEGEFSHMENMTSDHFPVLSTRERRGRLAELAEPCCFTGGCYVSGKGLYFACNEQGLQGEEEHGSLYLLTPEGELKLQSKSLSVGKKSLVLMGSALTIFPDGLWLDIQEENPVFRKMGEDWSVKEGKVTLSLCSADGTDYQNVAKSADPPSNPGNCALWLDSSQLQRTLKQYQASTAQWVTVPTTYVKISGLGDHYFETGDGVHISGLGPTGNGPVHDLNGCHVIQKHGHDYIVIPGILDQTEEQDCTQFPVQIQRRIPKLDFVVEAGNRLWGCIRDKNEIYASKLGDYKNWDVFSGLSTDSWVGNVGSPGDFTGGINQGGYPVFYKETCKHKIWPSSTGAHQISSTPCHGVEKGSEGSLVLLDGVVLYKSPAGVFADDGSGPVEIGQALGTERYRQAQGGTRDRKYYLSMLDGEGQGHLFVYDLSRQLWHRESYPSVGRLIGDGSSLYTAHNTQVWDLTGRTGTPEEQLFWCVRTGEMVEGPDRQYLSRVTLEMSLEMGGKVEIYGYYDGEPIPVKLGTTYGRKPGIFSLPIRPRRCHRLQLELRGEGMGKIYSITRTFGKGSELR